VSIPLPPCRAVSLVSYLNGAGTVQVVDPDNYIVSGLNGDGAAQVRPTPGCYWPRTRSGVAEPITVEFEAGYTTLPPTLRQAILLHVAHLYERREAVTVGTGYIETTPLGYDELIRGHRLWAF